MKQITNREKVLIIALLALTAFCTLTKTKQYNYKSIQYNKQSIEKYPVIDTILGTYQNTKPIFVRTGYKIQGHDKIGVCTGGSQMYFECSDKCKKCVSLNGE